MNAREYSVGLSYESKIMSELVWVPEILSSRWAGQWTKGVIFARGNAHAHHTSNTECHQKSLCRNVGRCVSNHASKGHLYVMSDSRDISFSQPFNSWLVRFQCDTQVSISQQPGRVWRWSWMHMKALLVGFHILYLLFHISKYFTWKSTERWNLFTQITWQLGQAWAWGLMHVKALLSSFHTFQNLS